MGVEEYTWSMCNYRLKKNSSTDCVSQCKPSLLKTEQVSWLHPKVVCTHIFGVKHFERIFIFVDITGIVMTERKIHKLVLQMIICCTIILTFGLAGEPFYCFLHFISPEMTLSSLYACGTKTNSLINNEYSFGMCLSKR